MTLNYFTTSHKRTRIHGGLIPWFLVCKAVRLRARSTIRATGYGPALRDSMDPLRFHSLFFRAVTMGVVTTTVGGVISFDFFFSSDSISSRGDLITSHCMVERVVWTARDRSTHNHAITHQRTKFVTSPPLSAFIPLPRPHPRAVPT